MASSLIVPIVEVAEIKPHPNADKLELCTVLGWQLVVPKGQFKVGDKYIYFPIDTLIPKEWADKWGVTKYLKGKDNNRVGKVKLRGEPSFGVLIDTSHLPVVPESRVWSVGCDVADYFGAKKYEPPVRPTAGDAETPHPLRERFTDIENMRNFPDIFQDGEEVVATEKLHGTNCSCGILDGTEIAASMELMRKKPADFKTNTYWFPWSLPGVGDLLRHFKAKQVILYGEVYGCGIQKLHYGLKNGFTFAAFDILVDGKYLDYDDFTSVCALFGVPTVPLLYRGPFSLEKIKEVSEGKTTIGGGEHIREGTVVRPVKERTDPKTGRVCLKYISDSYLFRGDEDDVKDV